MDPLIRSAQLAPFRTRLSEMAASRDPVSSAGASPDAQRGAPRSAQEALRAEIEKQVRSELATHMQNLYDSERERARAAGHAIALAEARVAAEEELKDLSDQLKAAADQALSAMAQAHQAVLSKLESSVGEVSFAAICRLVGHNAASQTFMLGLIEQTCAQLRADALATARLHPRDVQTLRDLLQDHELRVSSLALKVVPDDSVKLGGCVIEAASGQYDGGLESQLRRLHAVLVGDAATESAIRTSSAISPTRDVAGG
jgi:flagellar biosynthesis/type III secretory pathway protein FliH